MYQRSKYLKSLINKRNNGLIKIITGPRRCGKSYLMNTIFYNHLIHSEIDSDHIISFAFDNPNDLDLLDSYYPETDTKIKIKKDFYNINSKKFRAFIKDKIKDEKEYILLLDEIQMLEDFVLTLNGFLYQKNLDVYVTGSNAFLLSSDIDTMFSSRGCVIKMYPLSFSEFYSDSSLDKNEAFRQYSLYGGLPLVTLMKDNDYKLEYLKSTANETYLKDIITRHGIKGVSDLEDLYDILASSIGSIISPTRLIDTFKSIKNKDITDDTISSYISYFVDAFIMNLAKVYNIKGKKFINSPYKLYFEDIGIRNAIVNSFGNDMGYVIENIVYNDLLYKGYDVSIGQLSYSELNSKKELVKVNFEIDFIATKNYEKFYVQVCLNIENEEVYKREIKSFKKINDSFKKILVVKDGLFKRIDETGVVIVDLFDLLLADDINL